MKALLLLSVACSMVAVSLAVRGAVHVMETCMEAIHSEPECDHVQNEIFRDYQRIWSGDHERVFQEWLDYRLPSERIMTEREKMQYCILRQCRQYAPLTNYINSRGYPPFCPSKAEIVNNHFWTKCKIHRDTLNDIDVQDYTNMFCHYAYGTADVDLTCPGLNVVQADDHPNVMDMQKDMEKNVDARPNTDQWWIGLMKGIEEISMGREDTPSFKYGWISNVDFSDLHNVVPQWSPYQGTEVPDHNDLANIMSILDVGGDLVFKGRREFECEPQPHSSTMICEEKPGRLADNPLHMLIIEPTHDHVLIIGTDDSSRERDLMRAAHVAGKVMKLYEL
uniref:Luciferase 8 n=1 Tax=Odontosyllis octodentata TaxID=2336528 RepID=A0A5A4PZH0_9ANNE|nr:luciferase 8 [Odontosyllis octodentata]